jgi:tRNA nucleotidyltransferase/poly(A) polymerase
MADYIYLLESRLSQAQQRAVHAVREIARAKGLTVFLVGGAVRDLTSGSPVRDLDVVVQGNALKLKKDLEKAGATITGEGDTMQALFVTFPGSVRMEVGSTLSVHYPKPGKPVVKPATILDDLRRRDFTANAMALSLNEGSYGLLMDPLNGVADIENRELRLVSNYGFIEDPVRMIRAARYAARLGWQMEEKTHTRYETGKAEDYISAISAFQRGYESEEIVHEEDPLRVMRKLEQEDWMKVLAPAWDSAKANVAELDKLREAQMQLQMRGIHADPSAAQFPLLTAKMHAKDVEALKKTFPRQGFVEEIEALEAEGKQFAAEFGSKQAATPSAAWKMLMTARPEAVLWVAYSTKSAVLQAKFKSFYTDWPQARQRIPYTQMQEMRIVPELPGYDELVEKIFFELMDGKLQTPEEMKAFLEPYSPPAPPPTVHLRRPRSPKKDAKAAKARKKAEADEELAEDGEGLGEAEAGPAADEASDESASADSDESPRVAAAGPPKPKAASSAKPSAPAKQVTPAKPVVPVKAAAKPTEAKASVTKQPSAKVSVSQAIAGKAKTTAGKAAPHSKPGAKKAVPAKAAGKPAAKKSPAKKAPVKAAAAKPKPKVAAKASAKSPTKTAGKTPQKVATKPSAKSAEKTSKKTPVKATKKHPAKAVAKKKR